MRKYPALRENKEKEKDICCKSPITAQGKQEEEKKEHEGLNRILVGEKQGLEESGKSPVSKRADPPLLIILW